MMSFMMFEGPQAQLLGVRESLFISTSFIFLIPVTGTKLGLIYKFEFPGGDTPKILLSYFFMFSVSSFSSTNFPCWPTLNCKCFWPWFIKMEKWISLVWFIICILITNFLTLLISTRNNDFHTLIDIWWYWASPAMTSQL